MAGIGFTLRKLARQDNLSGISLAFFHSSAASTGPWICTILMQVAVAYFGSRHLTYDELYNFRVLIIYNFCISLLFTSPVSMVCTRYLSDMIYFRDVTKAIGMLLGSLAFIFITQSIFAFAFYCSVSNLNLFTISLVVINLLAVSATWQISIFLSALKNYLAISGAFFIGFVVTFVACMLFPP